ncbi:MAG: BfmA/BtgA family mobilization protein, partial [Bacteroidota bacterium]
MRKSLSTISPEFHQQLKRLAFAKGVSQRVYLELMIAYFEHTGLDPSRLPNGGGDKQIVALKKQVDFIVKLIRRIEQDTLHPMTDSLVGMEEVLRQFDKPPANAYPPIELLRCPKCQVEFAQIHLNQADTVICPQCDFKLPLQIGNVMLQIIDVYTLLAGGLTRTFHQLRLKEGEFTQARFCLNESAQ